MIRIRMKTKPEVATPEDGYIYLRRYLSRDLLAKLQMDYTGFPTPHYWQESFCVKSPTPHWLAWLDKVHGVWLCLPWTSAEVDTKAKTFSGNRSIMITFHVVAAKVETYLAKDHTFSDIAALRGTLPLTLEEAGE